MSPDSVERANLLTGDLSRLRPLLRPLIEVADRVPAMPEAVRRGLGAGLVAVLCVQGREGIHRVHREDVRRWAVDPAELWALAMHNLRRIAPEPTTRSNGWWSFSDDGQFAASQLLRVDEILPGPLPHGVLMLVPARYLLYLSPVRGLDWLQEIMTLTEVTRNAARDSGAQGLSAKVLWWSAGHLNEIGLERKPGAPADQHPTVLIPQGLRPLLLSYEKKD